MGRGSHFVAMTTPMSLQLWWWQIFILIQLWSQFFQMFVYGDVVYAQTWYWPWKPYRATFICQDGLCCCNMALISFRLFRKNLGNLRGFFGQMVYRPPWQKISRTPMLRTSPHYLNAWNRLIHRGLCVPKQIPWRKISRRGKDCELNIPHKNIRW